MPRGVKNAAQTVAAVNGDEYDKLTPGFDDDDITVEHEGRYRVVTPRAVSFTAYGLKFTEGIAKTDDVMLASKLKDEFGYKIVDTQKPGHRVPMPEPLPEPEPD